MEGVNDPPELRGIIPRAFHQIFDMIASRGGTPIAPRGPPHRRARAPRPAGRGLEPRPRDSRLRAAAGETTEFLVRASYLEIYNEEIRDLLSKNGQNRLDIKDSQDTGVYVKDLTSYVGKSVRECDKLRDFGARNRHVGATAMNQVRQSV